MRKSSVLVFHKGELVYTSPNEISFNRFIDSINRKADGKPIYSLEHCRPEVYIESYQDKYSVDSKGRFRIASDKYQEGLNLNKKDNVVGNTKYINTKNNEWLAKINRGSYYSID